MGNKAERTAKKYRSRGDTSGLDPQSTIYLDSKESMANHIKPEFHIILGYLVYFRCFKFKYT